MQLVKGNDSVIFDGVTVRLDNLPPGFYQISIVLNDASSTTGPNTTNLVNLSYAGTWDSDVAAGISGSTTNTNTIYRVAL